MLNLCPSEDQFDAGDAFTVYQIDIERPEGLMTYTGWTSQGLEKRAQDYRREVGRLLKGVPHNRAGGYRAIHLALAAAMLEGWFASIRIVAGAKNTEEARMLERQREAQIPAAARLNGRNTEACRETFRQIVAEHLCRLGLDEDSLQAVLRDLHMSCAISPGEAAHHIEPLSLPHPPARDRNNAVLRALTGQGTVDAEPQPR
ncbi:hypothetical protein R3X27_10715 [Tropicimonas sp. TH_r6]|uniref:hypothetical protein n=1 Tax=Tropicimonas sp. TH_r6 TaxID=3082085 RepID=UPI00295299C4|nr:hypothetical protein [Tropicimonas sp. TH_r6]MDV7143156.1 hypothetical protein [Tropicimonas sp. TH_r6]